MVRVTPIAFAATVALVGGPALPAMAEEAGQYTFTVLRDGDPIGEYHFAYQSRGERVEIESTTDLEVTFAMIPVFEFQNQIHEVWENGRPVSIVSKTNDDGEHFDITVKPNGEGLIRTVNGRVDHFAPEVKVLGFWDKDVVNHDSFFSVVEDKVVDASFELVGKEVVEVQGTPLATERYRMVGDIERDVWFDQRGHAVKVEFEKRGSHIAYVRNEAEPRPIQCASATQASASDFC